MTGNHLEIISQIVLWYENSFRIDWTIPNNLYHLCPSRGALADDNRSRSLTVPREIKFVRGAGLQELGGLTLVKINFGPL